MRAWAAGLFVAVTMGSPALADSCSNPPPDVRSYLQSHADWRLRTRKDIGEDAPHSEWQKINGVACPGWARADLDGQGPVYVLMLARRSGGDGGSKIAIPGHDAWEKSVNAAVPYMLKGRATSILVKIAPGKYEDQYDHKHILLKHDAMVVGEWEAGATALYLINGRLRKFIYSE